MSKFLYTSLLTLSLCAVACGSGSQPGTGGAGAGGGTSSGGQAGGGGSVATALPEAELADRFAATMCDLSFACGCPGAFTSKETCVNQTRAKLQTAQKAAHDQQLNYDADCAGKLLARLEARSCAAAAACVADVCRPYYGTTTFGGACEPGTSIVTSTCAQASICSYQDSGQGQCGEPCPQAPQPLPLGTPCLDAQGQPNKRCGEGEVCAHDHGGTCTSLPKEGEVCVDEFACGDGLHCVNTVCVARRPNGDPCTKEIECLGGRCSSGACADLPAFCDPFASPI